ncbi:M23 family metallopeptidase [Fodinicurvata halophila]|uniref:M23 family metallopeptidase n=1 Tax=Fodinicurvata halophila TaxID=1419723 RepID=UPI0036331992
MARFRQPASDRHQDGWVSAYGHNSRLLVGRGVKVERGQPIAEVGASGSVSKPQLHFELRKGTRAMDPIELLED